MTESGKWKLLAVTPDEAEVQLLRGRLLSEGITCRIETAKSYPGPPHGGGLLEYKAYVPVSDFEASQQILDEEDLDEEP